MKFRLLLLALFVVGSLTLAHSLAADEKEKKADAPAASQPTTAAAKPINKFCAVEQENPIDPTVPTVTYKGKTIGFCCEDCAPKFKKNPEKYMKTIK